MYADNRQDLPAEADATADRDFALGMTIGCVMAFGSLALAIILSVT